MKSHLVDLAPGNTGASPAEMGRMRIGARRWAFVTGIFPANRTRPKYRAMESKAGQYCRNRGSTKQGLTRPLRVDPFQLVGREVTDLGRRLLRGRASARRR